ncbi:MAG: hypothetical protein U0667_08005 [Chloroflexota bacterium]
MLLRAAFALACLATLLAPIGVAAAAPTDAPSAPTAAPVIGTGDSRSDGEGPGLVGSPVGIALGVILVGAVTAVGTLVILRIAPPRRRG